MKKSTLLALCLLAASAPSFAQEENEDQKLTIDISGEIDASIKNYNGDRFENEHEGSTKARIPYFGISGEYNISPSWTANADVEFVSGSGIQVDELSVTHSFLPWLNLKGGMFMLPISHANAGLGYTDFFLTGDPEGDMSMAPCPISETGLSLLGEFENGIDYQLSVTTGMNAQYMSAQNWAYDCTQGFFDDEVNFTSPAYSFKLGYTGIEGLTLNAGVYYCSDISKNMSYSSLFKDYCGLKTPLTMWFADGEYANDYFTLRASYLQGTLKNSLALTDFFNDVPELEDIDYTEGVIAKGVQSYMVEAGLNLKACFYPESKGPELIPFVHYECYDTQKELEQDAEKLDGSNVKLWAFGINYKPLENITFKCNYTTRNLGSGIRNMNELNLAVAFDLSIL